MKKKIILSLMFVSCFFSGLSARNNSMYTEDEFSNSPRGDAFHIHMGNNIWLVTDIVEGDQTGIFTYEGKVNRLMQPHVSAYEKKWKCPYCFSYWPIGTPCQNKECPSRYKD